MVFGFYQIIIACFERLYGIWIKYWIHCKNEQLKFFVSQREYLFLKKASKKSRRTFTSQIIAYIILKRSLHFF